MSERGLLFSPFYYSLATLGGNTCRSHRFRGTFIFFFFFYFCFLFFFSLRALGNFITVRRQAISSYGAIKILVRRTNAHRCYAALRRVPLLYYYYIRIRIYRKTHKAISRRFCCCHGAGGGRASSECVL